VGMVVLNGPVRSLEGDDDPFFKLASGNHGRASETRLSGVVVFPCLARFIVLRTIRLHSRGVDSRTPTSRRSTSAAHALSTSSVVGQWFAGSEREATRPPIQLRRLPRVQKIKVVNRPVGFRTFHSGTRLK
jgi:hypothetical protein